MATLFLLILKSKGISDIRYSMLAIAIGFTLDFYLLRLLLL